MRHAAVALLLTLTAACQGPQGTHVRAEDLAAVEAERARATTPPPRATSAAPHATTAAASAASDDDELLAKRRAFDERRLELDRRREDRERALADLAAKRRRTAIQHRSQQAEQEVALADAERKARLAREDLDHFLDAERDRKVREDELNLTASKDSLLETREELAQLELMYDDSDLGDDTAEIVLNRTRRRLARAEERHALVVERSGDLRSIELPRQEEELKSKLRAAELALESKRREIEAAAITRDLDLRGIEKEELALNREAEDLERETRELDQDVKRWEQGLASRPTS